MFNKITYLLTPNLVVERQGVWALVGAPQNWGSAGAPPLGRGAWLTPKIRPPTQVNMHNLVALCQTVWA